MAVIVETSNPYGLLSDVLAAIDEGEVRTWTYDEEGDLSHAPAQWAGKAWMRPDVQPSGTLVFNIIAPRGTRLTKAVYAVYHGRLVEMLLSHFDTSFSSVHATALPAVGDGL